MTAGALGKRMRRGSIAVLPWLALALALGLVLRARSVEPVQEPAPETEPEPARESAPEPTEEPAREKPSADPLSAEAIGALIAADRLDEADAAISRRLQAAKRPGGKEWMVLVFQRSEIARLRWDWKHALAELDRIEAYLDKVVVDGIPEEKLHAHRSWLHGARAQVYVEVGCLRDASRELAEEERHALATGIPELRVDPAFHAAAFELALGEYDLALDALEAFPAPSRGEPHAALNHLYRGSILLELEREEPERTREAADALRAALDEEPAAGVRRL
ncbi:MAG TPA: hypothetical protein VJP77_02310, partial [Planctomycetota bacterium]|nr:hypothetical protein [Planctomycetota bacterium]